MNRVTFLGGPLPLFTVVVAAVITLALAPAQPALAEFGDCVTATVDAPFRVPDGRVFPAGRLTLCDSGTYSPVDELDRKSVV